MKRPRRRHNQTTPGEGGGGGDAVWGGDVTHGHGTSVSEAKQNKNKKKNLQDGMDRRAQWLASTNLEEGRGEVDAASSGWRYRRRAWEDDGTARVPGGVSDAQKTRVSKERQ